jgi:hypothetical protein
MMQESQFFMATISVANLTRDNDRLLILIAEAGAPEATDFICLIFYVHCFHCVSRLVASRRERPRSLTYKEIGSAEFHQKSNGLVVGEIEIRQAEPGYHCPFLAALYPSGFCILFAHVLSVFGPPVPSSHR